MRKIEKMRFLVSIHRPQDFDHSVEITSEVMKAIDDVNDQMEAAGVRKFVAGLRSPKEARALRLEAGGNVIVTDGPYLETKDYVDGFWVLECANLEEAVEWGRKAAAACRGSVEVRPIHGP